MRVERRSSPHWLVAWFLSPRCSWRRKVKRTRTREGKTPLPPLPAHTLTSWHAAFSTLELTAPSGSCSRTQTPPHPPKHRGTLSCEDLSVSVQCTITATVIFFVPVPAEMGDRVWLSDSSVILVCPLSRQAAACIVWFQRGDARRRFSDSPTHQEASAPEEENQAV